MATLFSHALVGGLLADGAVPGVSRRRAAVVLGLLAVLPDVDVVAFSLGISYGHPLGHRGITHSLPFALVLAPIAVRVAFPRLERFSRDWWRMTALCALACASHGFLDAFTDAGRGVGFLLPFDATRFFFPFRPIATSPIGVASFLDRGLPILMNEARWIVLPALTLALCVRWATRARPTTGAEGQPGRGPA